jgi:hypothetical protein
MADSISASQLYSGITQLAYAESQMAANPRAPFQLTDRHGLVVQATDVANCAASFRQKSAAALGDLTVAQQSVHQAIAMFAAINNNISTTLTTQEVIAAVNSAIQQVTML